MKDMVGNGLTDEQYYKECVEIETKTKIARYFVNNFPTNILKSTTFLHPMGVCGWTFHRTGVQCTVNSGKKFKV